MELRAKQVVWNMPTQVHRVVQNSYDVNCPYLINAVKDEVAPSSAPAPHVQGAQTGPNLVPRLAVGKVRTLEECFNCRDECAAIDGGLAPTKFLCRPLNDSDKVALGCFR